MLGVLLIYPHFPSGAACPRDCAYISVKPLAAMLRPINVCMYVHMYIGTYIHAYVCTFIV